MEEQQLQALAEKVAGRIFIPLEASGRHVHITAAQAEQLFGHRLTPQRPLSQPGQFLAKERVTLVGPKGEFRNVAVLGPERKEAQVEISRTDGRHLGIRSPVRPSGSVAETPGATLIGPKGQVILDRGVIAARRHIHMTPADADAMGIRDGQIVRLRVYTERPVTFEDVQVRVREDFATYCHLDYDEANAIGFRKGDLGRILS
jgi:propanediol utilization protein